MTAAIVPPELPPAAPPVETAAEQRFLVHGLDWATYGKLLDVFIDRGPRICYLDGMVELMSPGPTHGSCGRRIGRMIETLTEELDIPLKALGSTTLRRPILERAQEADQTYHLANARSLGPLGDKLDLETVPPPDLVVEVEITSALLDKLALCAGLGIPEVWRHDGRTLRVLLLPPDGTYDESPRSRAFPFLPMAAFAEHIVNADPTDDTGWARAFRGWVRAAVVPLHGA